MITILLLMTAAQVPQVSSVLVKEGVGYSATLALIGDCGLLWIKPGASSGASDFVDIIDDPSFEPRRVCAYRTKVNRDSRIIFAEYYRSSWTYGCLFVVNSERVVEVLGVSYRDPGSLRLISDKAGNLIEVRLRDRWIGAAMRPAKLKLDPAPGKRWELESRFYPQATVPWKAHHSEWHAITVP